MRKKLCSVKGCKKEKKYKNLCISHYQKDWYRKKKNKKLSGVIPVTGTKEIWAGDPVYSGVTVGAQHLEPKSEQLVIVTAMNRRRYLELVKIAIDGCKWLENKGVRDEELCGFNRIFKELWRLKGEE